MTPSELKRAYEEKVGGHFFARKSMAFFGDSMRNYGVADAGTHWELYRRRPVLRGLSASMYFHKETLKPTSQKPAS